MIEVVVGPYHGGDGRGRDVRVGRVEEEGGDVLCYKDVEGGDC